MEVALYAQEDEVVLGAVDGQRRPARRAAQATAAAAAGRGGAPVGEQARLRDRLGGGLVQPRAAALDRQPAVVDPVFREQRKERARVPVRATHRGGHGGQPRPVPRGLGRAGPARGRGRG